MKNTSQYRIFVISLFRYVQRLTKYEHQYEVGKKNVSTNIRIELLCKTAAIHQY